MLRPGDEPIRGYRLEAFLGQGQFGQVWKTSAPGGGSAALKFLDLTGKEGQKELRGIQRVKAIRHAHLMPITALWVLDEDGNVLHDDALLELTPPADASATLAPGDLAASSHRPRWLVVAQVLAEKTLRDQLNGYHEQGQPGIPVAELLTYIEEAAKGIDYLNAESHDLGEGVFAVQHCDIKPANMLLVGGSVMVCDFGLAHILEGEPSSRSTGIPGSPAFIAPECIDQQPSASSDQYSLAVSYYELRTGQLPFDDTSPLGALDAHRQGKLEYSLVPSAEADVLRKATARNPSERYGSCLDFVRALKRATGTSVVPAAESRRTSSLPLMGLIAILLVAGAMGYWFLPDESMREFRIQVEPAGAELKIDGETVALSEGAVELVRPLAASLNVVVSAGPEYDVYSARIDVRDYTLENPSTIKLTTSALSLAERAYAKWETQDDAAVALLVQAIEKDRRFLTLPSPIQQQAPQGTAIARIAVAADGTSFVTGSRQGHLFYWNAPALAPKALQKQRMAIDALRVSGRHVLAADMEQNVVVHDTTTGGSTAFRVETLDPILLAAESGARDVVTASGEQLVRWQRESGGEFRAIPLGKHADSVAAVHRLASGEVVSAGWDGEVRLWSPSGDGSTLAKIDGEIFTCDVHGPLVAFGGQEAGGENHVYLVQTGMPPATALPDTLRNPVGVVRFSPQGDLLAAATEDDGRVWLWRRENTGSWQRVPMPARHAASATSLAWTEGWLLSGDNAGRVVIWNPQDTARAADLLQGLAPITQLAVVGPKLFVLTEDGTLFQLDLARCRLILRAAAEAGIDSVGPPTTTGVEA